MAGDLDIRMLLQPFSFSIRIPPSMETDILAYQLGLAARGPIQEVGNCAQVLGTTRRLAMPENQGITVVGGVYRRRRLEITTKKLREIVAEFATQYLDDEVDPDHVVFTREVGFNENMAVSVEVTVEEEVRQCPSGLSCRTSE